MLANQLPLPQSGLEPVSVQDQVSAFCQPDGADFAGRLSQKTELIACSDPNHLLSYPIPDAFVRDHVDSRLRPGPDPVLARARRVRQPALGAWSTTTTSG